MRFENLPERSKERSKTYFTFRRMIFGFLESSRRAPRTRRASRPERERRVSCQRAHLDTETRQRRRVSTSAGREGPSVEVPDFLHVVP